MPKYLQHKTAPDGIYLFTYCNQILENVSGRGIGQTDHSERKACWSLPLQPPPGSIASAFAARMLAFHSFVPNRAGGDWEGRKGVCGDCARVWRRLVVFEP